VRTSVPLLAALALGLVAVPALADQPMPATDARASVGGRPTTGEHALASKLLAPCCWNQTLDVHTSDVALNLRREIRTRLSAGETPAAIEADLVARYGDRILAVPEGSPLGTVAAIALGAVGLAGLGILLLGFRWRRRTRRAEATETAGGSDPRASAHGSDGGPTDEWDERLEAELREM
jgi:cytochrome c-type biogenesis protein CcmH